MVVCFRYDWTGASFQVFFSVAKLYLEDLSALKNDRMTGTIQLR